MMAESPAAAAAFIEGSCAPEYRPVANLFRANAAGAHDEQWSEHVSAYLRQFDLLPLTVRPGPERRFDRLTCPPAYRIADGPLVSIIMPAFNAQATLEHAARSILDQTWRHLELFIVDDASTDCTLSIAHRLAAADGRVKPLHNSDNVGPYVSKNRALKLAAGAYLTGHDADDWAHPQRIERQLAAMTQRSNVAASIASMLRITGQGEFREFKSIGRTSFDGAARLASISCLFAMDAFRHRLGHWDQVRFGADSELIERARMVFGAGFHTERLITMLCLDSPGSLTNHAVHGVDTGPQGGLSPARAEYRASWLAWHRSLDAANARLEFPQASRRFAAPEAMLVGGEDAGRVVE